MDIVSAAGRLTPGNDVLCIGALDEFFLEP